MTECPRHHVPLKDDTIQLRSPLGSWPPWGVTDVASYYDEREETFPYSLRWMGKACDDPEQRARVRFCPACREREAAWVVAHGGHIQD